MATKVSFNYITTLSNAAHEFAIHAEADDSNCDFAADTVSGNYLMVIDLGPAY
jgi:hypothetical protein